MHPTQRRHLGIALALSLAFAACAVKPPPNWVQGGSPVSIGPARWSRSGSTVEIRPDGKVLIDGDTQFAIDAAGRVFEADGDPIAVLQSDGTLVGTDSRGMGVVGWHTSAAPGESVAWLGIGEKGELIRFDPDGDRSQDGYWQGCDGPQRRACMLVSHYIVLREMTRPRFGVGIGIMMVH